MPNLGWWRNERGVVYVVVQLVLLALVATGPLQASWPLVPAVLREPALWTGGLFIVLGVTLAVVSVIVLGRNLSPLPHPKADATSSHRDLTDWCVTPSTQGLFWLRSAGRSLPTPSLLSLTHLL